MSRTFDLLDVIAARLKDGGVKDASTRLSDGATQKEAVVIRAGAPTRESYYFDGARDVEQNITLYAKRIREDDAENTAETIGSILRSADLSSDNGSYQNVSIATSTPRSVGMDISGAFVWALDVTVNLIRKD